MDGDAFIDALQRFGHGRLLLGVALGAGLVLAARAMVPPQVISQPDVPGTLESGNTPWPVTGTYEAMTS